MRILILHNQYRVRGGEDAVVETEVRLLRDHGHEVVIYGRSNACMGLGERFSIPQFVWSRRTYQDLTRLIRATRPELAHIHNPFFLMTPSAYQACRDQRLPMVQTLHNYRFLCANGIFFRNGKVCEDCLSQGRASAMRHRCFQGSWFKTGLVAWIMAAYRRNRVLDDYVRRLIAPSEFCKSMYVRYAGLSPKKIIVKPHGLDDPGVSSGSGRYVLYAGALRDYKGIQVLLEAARRMPEVPIRIVGKVLPEFCLPSDLPHVEFLGECSTERTIAIMKDCACLVVPSLCYETFARVVIEAYACGRPVIASRLGALTERVDEGVTGFLADPGSAQDFADKIQRLMQDPDRRRIMGEDARRAYEQGYTLSQNYRQLMDVYEKALDKEG